MKCMIALGLIALASVAYGQTIPELATQAGLTTLVDLVVKAGLADTLSGEGPFTVFAPTNEAFEKLPAEIVDMLMEDNELLKKVLMYHVVPGKVMSADITNDLMADTADEGSQLRINQYLKSDFYAGFVTVNGKRVSKADVEASNGVVHVMADVIYPFPMGDIPTALTNDPEGRFTTLLAAVDAADLGETLMGEGPFTLFAPTNEAFAKIPEADLAALLDDRDALTEVLLRHVVPDTLWSKGITWMIRDTAGGSQIQTQVFKGNVIKYVSALDKGARVIDADIPATNGVIHAIDTVV